MTAVRGLCSLHRLEQLLSVYGCERGREGSEEGGSEGAGVRRMEQSVKLHHIIQLQ